jgi:hypothetical protein
MNFAKHLLQLDIYKSSADIYINKESKHKTWMGTYISLLMIIFSFTVIYLEFHDVFTKTNPTIITNTFESEFYNPDLKLTSENFRFRLNPSNQTLAKYFKIDYYVNYYHLDKGVYRPDTLTLTDLAGFYPTMSSKNLKAFNVTIGIRQCEQTDKGCVVDPELYQRLQNGTQKFEIAFEFIYSTMNIHEGERLIPQRYRSALILSKESSVAIVKLKPVEITTVSNAIFDYTNTFRTFALDGTDVKHTPGLKSYISIICPRSQILVIKRHYKGVTSAIANSYTVIAIFFYLSNLLVASYYKYSINKIILLKNFDVEKSISGTRGTNIQLAESSDVSSGGNVIKYTNVNREIRVAPPSKCPKWLRWLDYLRCCRKEQSRSIKFTAQANSVIRKYLSVENIFNIMLDYLRVKDVLLDRGDINFSTSRKHIVKIDKDLSARGYRRLLLNQFDNPGTIV